MALRPIDNAQPTPPPESPMKQTKVAISMLKQSEIGVNDENRTPLSPPSADASFDYISSHNLGPLLDPEIKAPRLLEGLESKDWLKVCESMNNARRLALYHPSLLLPILEKVLLVLVKAMKSPRSALCKTSIMATSDIFKAFGDKLPDSNTSVALDQMLLQLLLKASQDKKFVCEEADRTLNTMVEFMTPLPLLCKLRVYVSHSNLRVRAKAAISISQCVSKMELEGMKEFGLVPLLQLAVDLLNDRLPEAREAARSIVSFINEAYTESKGQEESWQNFCQANLPPIHAAQVIVKIALSQ